MAEPVSEARQKAYFEHDHSSERFLIAHQEFSKMMESFVAEGLVDDDEATRTATLTDAGRQFIE